MPFSYRRSEMIFLQCNEAPQCDTKLCAREKMSNIDRKKGCNQISFTNEKSLPG